MCRGKLNHSMEYQLVKWYSSQNHLNIVKFCVKTNEAHRMKSVHPITLFFRETGWIAVSMGHWKSPLLFKLIMEIHLASINLSWIMPQLLKKWSPKSAFNFSNWAHGVALGNVPTRRYWSSFYWGNLANFKSFVDPTWSSMNKDWPHKGPSPDTLLSQPPRIRWCKLTQINSCAGNPLLWPFLISSHSENLSWQ